MDLWKLDFTGQSKSKARGSGSSHGSQNAITKHPTNEAAPRFPRWLSGKGSACNTGDTRDAGSIPGSGRCPGGGNGIPCRLVGYSPWGHKESDMT